MEPVSIITVVGAVIAVVVNVCFLIHKNVKNLEDPSDHPLGLKKV